MRFLKSIAAALAVGLGLSAGAVCDRPEIRTLGGTGYHAGRWFTLGASVHSDGDSLLFDSAEEFVLSPRYDAPIRKVVLKAKVSSDSVTRRLYVMPMVDGLEAPTDAFACEVTGLSTDYRAITFDFRPDDRVDAVRICLGEKGGGTVRVSQILLLHGEKTPDEDESLREYARLLPTPANLTVVDFALDSLKLKVDEVAGAAGYRLAVDRLDGVPRTVCREDFVRAPDLSDGWTFGATANVTLGQSVGTSSGSYPDHKTSDDGRSLLIQAKGAGKALVEILSPEVPAAVTEYSFVSKRATGDESSDRVIVFGRKRNTSEWTALGEVLTVQASKLWTTNAVPPADGICQLKFVFSADCATARNCSLDTLRVVYGGDVTRVPAADSFVEKTVFELTGLQSGATYAFRAKAVAPTGETDLPYADSSWTDEQTISLSWATLEVRAPESVVAQVDGGELTVGWQPVANADHYLVSVTTVGYPAETIVDGKAVFGTSVTLDEVTALGEYEVTVTAVAPGGKSTASASAVPVEVALGKVGAVTATPTDLETLSAAWQPAPFADGYLVSAFRLEGETTDHSADFSSLPDAWPVGWTHHPEWTAESRSFWTNGEVSCPKFFRDAWFATDACPDAISRIVFSAKSGTSAPEVLEAQALVVEGSTSQSGDADWEAIVSVTPTTSLARTAVDVPYAKGVRRIRLRVAYARSLGEPDVRLGALAVTCGERRRRFVKELHADKPSTVVGGLSADGLYVIRVTPLPGGDESLAAESDVIDLSVMKPRDVAPVSLWALRETKRYEEDFSSLASIRSGIDVKALELPHWQFRAAGVEPQKLAYTATCGSTGCGVFVVSDAARTEGSYLLATHANGTSGAMMGLAFANNGRSRIVGMALAFDSVQRSFQKEAKSQTLEYLVTDGATAIDTNGEWTPLAVSPTAPLTKADLVEGQSEWRQSQGPIALEGVRLQPGQALIVRWRDDAKSSSPMMGVDNVKFTFGTEAIAGFRMILR